MNLPFFGEKMSWTFIIRRAAAFLVLLFFLNLIFLAVELLTDRHFSVLPFQEHSIGFRIGLTLFWLVFWLFVYRILGKSDVKKKRLDKEK